MSWVQRGNDIDGEAADDQSGWSVSLSSDGTILAIGAPNNDGNGITNGNGHVRVYVWNGSSWIQRGSDIDGEGAGDGSGVSVSLSSDGNILAIGARYNNSNGSFSGHVRVYSWNGSSWIQMGSDIDGEAAGNQSGFSISLSSDGNILAIGSPYNNGNGSFSGHVRVYSWNGSSWVQMGSDIDGEATDDLSGWSVNLSSDGTILAIGAPFNDDNGISSGHVRVYVWNGSSWVQRGSDINGEAAGDQSGYSISLSSDGTILAIGAPANDGNGSSSGHVRVYSWNGSSWIQMGSDINGEAAGDQSGYSVNLSSDGTILAIGANGNDDNGSGSGHVRVYVWNGSSWVQRGSDINGEATGDGNGWSVNLSSDGTILAIGAPFNDDNGISSGHVRVYSWSEPTTTTGSPTSTTTTTTGSPTITTPINVGCSHPQYSTIQLKRATNGEFAAANIILASGEPGYAIDTRVLKIGDGITAWSQLLPVNVSGTVSFPSLVGSNNINISTVGNSYVISTVGLANQSHQHVLADITDFDPSGFAPSGHQHVIGDITGFDPSGHQHILTDITDFDANDYAPSGHQHILNDITDFNSSDYAPSGHQHVSADITDFNNVYDTAIFDLGYISYDTYIDWAIDKQIQTGSLDGSPLALYQGNGWPSNNISRDMLLELTVSYYDTSVSWPIVSYWYSAPPEPLPVAKHLILFRAMGTTINGHYLGSGVL